MTTQWELIPARITEILQDGRVTIEMLDGSPVPGGRRTFKNTWIELVKSIEEINKQIEGTKNISKSRKLRFKIYLV
jgi:hypothetical protein